MAKETKKFEGPCITVPAKTQHRIVFFVAGLAAALMAYTQAYGFFTGLPFLFGPIEGVILFLWFVILAWCLFSIAATGFIPTVVRSAISRLTRHSTRRGKQRRAG